MNAKKTGRLRRAKSTRMKIREQGAFRLSVHRTPRHIYAQVIAPDDNRVLHRRQRWMQVCLLAQQEILRLLRVLAL
jgi:ribosomal protein L18